MKEYVQTGDCSFDFEEFPTPADYADSGVTTQKLSKLKSVIDVFANRVFELKNDACTKILQEVSGLYAAVRAIFGGQPLLRVQVNTLLLSDVELTMQVARSVLSRE